jgi:hypothetical protein
MNDANEKTRMNRRHTIMTIANLANLANLASRAPIAYELLHRIGLERRRSRAIRAASCAGWIGVGMAVGSGLTLLLTPRTGPEMREHLGERAKRARDYVVTNGIEPARRASAAQAS